MSGESWRERVVGRYSVRPLPDYSHDPNWNRLVLAYKWAIRLLLLTFALGLVVSLIHGVAGGVVFAVGGAAFTVPFAAAWALLLHGALRRLVGQLPGPFSDWNNAAGGRGWTLAWRRR